MPKCLHRGCEKNAILWSNYCDEHNPLKNFNVARKSVVDYSRVVYSKKDTVIDDSRVSYANPRRGLTRFFGAGRPKPGGR